MTVEETIRRHIHKSHGLKKFIFRVIFKFLKMYIRSIDEVLSEITRCFKEDLESLRRTEKEDLESLRRTEKEDLEIYEVMLTDGIDLKLKEAMEK